ncbi:hypothetical protein [Gordonia sp. OPL2]|uniref:hypothetical protein n=1 Tax=Gordonia sp. OPL2 TaxID=2486274 RepID=UPI0021CCBB2E|nr:hypothetical protein [Gordonia sp. OPL2]
MEDDDIPELPITLTVDGEVFELTEGEGSQYSYTWLTGPNKGYGFSESAHSASLDPDVPLPEDLPKYRLTFKQHIESIRDFLSMIDPKTGYTE